MNEPEMTPIGMYDTFGFACHNLVPCFNQCCSNLIQALTPYDVLRLKNHLKLSARAFFEQYAEVFIGGTTGMPVASLRFPEEKDKICPFVTEAGCKVYPARPSSCRIYPLARALQFSANDGSVTEQYVLLREPHCRGFEEQERQTVSQWVSSQELDAYHQMNDALIKLITLKNQMRPGELSTRHKQLALMAFYDLDQLKGRALIGQLPEMDDGILTPLSENESDEAWLEWSMSWIAKVLFSHPSD